MYFSFSLCLCHTLIFIPAPKGSLSFSLCAFACTCFCVFLYVFFHLYLPLGVSFSFFCFSLLCVPLFPFFSLLCWLPSLSPSSLLVLASYFQVSLSLSVSFSPPCHRGAQRMITQRLMGGKELTRQKGASKPGEQPVWKLIMWFWSD